MALLSGSSEGGCHVVIWDDVAFRQELSDRPAAKSPVRGSNPPFLCPTFTRTLLIPQLVPLAGSFSACSAHYNVRDDSSKRLTELAEPFPAKGTSVSRMGRSLSGSRRERVRLSLWSLVQPLVAKTAKNSASVSMPLWRLHSSHARRRLSGASVPPRLTGWACST